MAPRRAEIASALKAGRAGEELADAFNVYETMERWLTEARDAARELQREHAAAEIALAKGEAKLNKLTA